jgi:CRISPR/Cas system CSM-associated protein Csm3 (group 7 of RAMP superfamily)
MLRKWLCRADVKITIEPSDPVLIKSGYATMDGADMVPVSTFRNGKPVYYFPGSSFKGVLRSHLERIARTLQPGKVPSVL